MGYKITRVTIFLRKFNLKLIDFLEAIIFYIKKSFHILGNKESTQISRQKIKKAGKILISNTKDNVWNWHYRLSSSESFRIFDEDA